ncbi:MAG: hypothetical protein M1831_003223 [Alyxoria varia]|nr:MAG: hypothetical protein M1831_003223 [Alyxoria varia]
MPLKRPKFDRYTPQTWEPREEDYSSGDGIPGCNARGKQVLCSSSPVETSQDTSIPKGPEHSPLAGRISPNESRQELIERVKKEQRAKGWLLEQSEQYSQGSNGSRPPSSRASPKKPLPALLPAPKIAGEAETTAVKRKSFDELVEAAGEIQRPRSALHSGDFREHESHAKKSKAQSSRTSSPVALPTQDVLSTSPPAPWANRSFPPSEQGGSIWVPKRVAPQRPLPFPQSRGRAASYTTRPSGFEFKPPTSPLVKESNNLEPEMIDSLSSRGRPQSPDRVSRRRTFSPRSLQATRATSFNYGFSSTYTRPLPNVRREGSFPYQAHQPRRSLNSFSETLPHTTSHTPSARSRRPSVASESSPSQRLPMVGGYEESILRGRMSSFPSRPFDFLAQIGVMGKGDCKSSLRCPPHVTIPFSAVFYNYGSRPTSPTADGPSPYVGMIDVENSLNKPAERPSSSRSHNSGSPNSDASRPSTPVTVGDVSVARRRRLKKARSNRQRPPRAPPKGSYRIPQQGQLQVVIKHPNKTAVKLYLVPYDLTGMETGQKTFIRQRSYSAGPIIDMPLSSRKNFGTDRPEAALSNSENPDDRPTLRYLIHLQICCPSRGRFYLCKNIRVVFANRVPDGKEKLRLETQVPEPRFSPYNPEKEAQSLTTTANSTPRNAPRDMSGAEEGSTQMPARSASGAFESPLALRHSSTQRALSYGDNPPDHKAGGFSFPPRLRESFTSLARIPSYDAEMADKFTSDGPDAQEPSFEDIKMHSPETPQSPFPRPFELISPSDRPSSPLSRQGSSLPTSQNAFERLSREEYTGLGGQTRTQSPRPADGLLTKRLRDSMESVRDNAPQPSK